MHVRLCARIAWFPVALLAIAHLLQPAIGVVHAHESEQRHGAARHLDVHGHGAGLPHHHGAAPLDEPQPEEEPGFHKLGPPAATLRPPAAYWVFAWVAQAGPDAYVASDDGGAAGALSAACSHAESRPPFGRGTPLARSAAAQPGGGLGRAPLLRGPPIAT
jgi:hypothetical protein